MFEYDKCERIGVNADWTNNPQLSKKMKCDDTPLATSLISNFQLK